MNSYNEMLPYIEHSDYDHHFWNAMRGKRGSTDRMERGKDTSTGTYVMAPISNNKYMKVLEKESLFRRIGTVIHAYNSEYRIFAKECSDLATWVPEGGEIPMAELVNDFTTMTVDSHKLAVFVKTDEAFIRDSSFDFAGYLTERLAQNFGRAEEDAFINGTGVEMPAGIVCPGKGAEVALTTDTITYDDVITLFFSTQPEYRRHGLWLMNDETALYLRTLKDDNGNYLWNHANDTILGKQVVISEYMPSIESGTMPIVFGDFRYYWIIGRRPVSVRTLKEKFVVLDQIGHLAFEFLDGKLIRREAVQGILLNSTNPADWVTE